MQNVTTIRTSVMHNEQQNKTCSIWNKTKITTFYRVFTLLHSSGRNLLKIDRDPAGRDPIRPADPPDP